MATTTDSKNYNGRTILFWAIGIIVVFFLLTLLSMGRNDDRIDNTWLTPTTKTNKTNN